MSYDKILTDFLGTTLRQEPRVEGRMRDSERYEAQAETVMRLAARADSPAEKQVYLNIAEGWKRLAGEAARNERQDVRPPERRSFVLQGRQ